MKAYHLLTRDVREFFSGALVTAIKDQSMTEDPLVNPYLIQT